MNMVFCATWNEHSPRKHTKNRCQRWHSAVSCCCYRTPPQATTAAACHCLSRGINGGAGVAACGGGSGSSSSGGSSGGSGGGSSAILFLVVVVILLLFACPLLVGIILPLFRRSLLFLQAASHPPSTHNGWLLFASKSTSKFLQWRGRAQPVDLRPQRILTPAPPPPPPIPCLFFWLSLQLGC